MRKAEVLAAALRARGGGWMFLLDADDLVSRHLGTTILESGAKAVVVKRGYRLDARTGQYQNLRKHWGKCGSCAAVRWDPSELPVTPLADNPPLFHEYCDTRHYRLPQFFSGRGWNWKFLNPPLVAYVVNHGSNKSDFLSTQSWKWALYFKLQQRKQWTSELDEQFGVNLQVRTQWRIIPAPMCSARCSGVRSARRSPRRGAFRVLLVRSQPCAFGLGEAFRSLFEFEAQDGLVVVDGDDDSVSGRPVVASFRGVISILNDIPLFRLSVKHSTGVGGKWGASSSAKI